LNERPYEASPEAANDLFEIWARIAEDSVDLANRIEGEFYGLFDSLGRMPGQGHVRKDLTSRPVLFFPMYSFLVVYQPDVRPVRIVAVLRGKRNLARILTERLFGSEA
jgi:antitoxin ParD1/3/4/toxin ParE1/3/4